jgi:hypothetical protein
MNKLCNVASCWIYIGILLGAHPILQISRIMINNYSFKRCRLVHYTMQKKKVMHTRGQQTVCLSFFIGFTLKHSPVTYKLRERGIPLGHFLPLIKISYRKLFSNKKCHGMRYSNIKIGSMR